MQNKEKARSMTTALPLLGEPAQTTTATLDKGLPLALEPNEIDEHN